MQRQLNVWIDNDLKDALTDIAQREGVSIKELTENMLQREIARLQGEAVEQQALPVIRKVFRSEFRKVVTQFSEDVQISHLLKEIKTCIPLLNELKANLLQQREA